MKKLLALLMLFMLLCSSGYAQELPDIPEITPVSMRPVASSEDAIAYAKELWQYDFIAGYREGLNWRADWIGGLYEIYADDAETGERALSLAVSPDGQIVYLLNAESGARRALTTGTGVYENNIALMNQMEWLARQSFMALVPQLNEEELALDSFRTESHSDDSYFVDFWQPMPDGIEGKGNVHRHIYLQVAPVVRVTFWVDMLLGPPCDVWERLEPGMGKG